MHSLSEVSSSEERATPFYRHVWKDWPVCYKAANTTTHKRDSCSPGRAGNDDGEALSYGILQMFNSSSACVDFFGRCGSRWVSHHSSPNSQLQHHIDIRFAHSSKGRLFGSRRSSAMVTCVLARLQARTHHQFLSRPCCVGEGRSQLYFRREPTCVVLGSKPPLAGGPSGTTARKCAMCVG